jgi:hypothetical protein
MILRKHVSSRFLWSIVTLLGTTIVAGCSDDGTITVSSGYGKGIKFSGLGPTYAWSPSPSMDRANPALGSAEFGELVRKVVENELAAKGFTPASAGPANFWVDYRIGKQKKTDSGVNPHGEVFGEGSLQLDVLDPQNGKMIWRGVAQARIVPKAPPELREKRLKMAVQRLMKDFPIK